ncbi:MAG: hypothetical protein ACYS8Z_05160 [Planctomycetota bacterium]
MTKNILITACLLLIAVFVTLLVSGRLRWVSHDDLAGESPHRLLEKAIELHRPDVLKIGDEELLYITISKLSGKNYSITHEFFTFENGTLKRVDRQ